MSLHILVPDRAVICTPERINCDMTRLQPRHTDTWLVLLDAIYVGSFTLTRWIHSHYLRHWIRSMYEHALLTGAQYPMIEASAERTLIKFIPPHPALVIIKFHSCAGEVAFDSAVIATYNVSSWKIKGRSDHARGHRAERHHTLGTVVTSDERKKRSRNRKHFEAEDLTVRG
ncbi:hypothetical protein H4582DRAFT_1981470 [Lactarius indigo]|nr:hypothetical protein H4582DRAFT_1981470 [Lactarius indigo]